MALIPLVLALSVVLQLLSECADMQRDSTCTFAPTTLEKVAFYSSLASSLPFSNAFGLRSLRPSTFTCHAVQVVLWISVMGTSSLFFFFFCTSCCCCFAYYLHGESSYWQTWNADLGASSCFAFVYTGKYVCSLFTVQYMKHGGATWRLGRPNKSYKFILFISVGFFFLSVFFVFHLKVFPHIHSSASVCCCSLAAAILLS